MGLQIRDERQMKALTGLSQVQFDSLLPVFSAIYRAAQQHAYEKRSQSGTRQRRPGGGSKGKLPTMVEKLQFVLYYYKTYPTFDVLGTQLRAGRCWGLGRDQNLLSLHVQVRIPTFADVGQFPVQRPHAGL